ncbi:DUF822 domain-containing protein [Cephalotus follicularis]|uniref:Protein BZR1 homolog n=1 Tax=Cephalotus follicularis TaxID=3775 RepID=A0A1Q3BGX0_CEPFO|nr:DUF822 domain-containing protein [Cephalotus follicularis]
MVGCSSRSIKTSSVSGGRSESEKEKTKMRERQRRAITTNIFNGLRKHGGYNLSPRADINVLLRELAREAGWVVEPDGTTYRSKIVNCCPVCGGGTKTSTNPSPTSSIIIGGGGDCSTTASPLRMPVLEDPIIISGSPITNLANSTSYIPGDGIGSGGFIIGDHLMALYMCGGFIGGNEIQNINTTTTATTRIAGGNGI